MPHAIMPHDDDKMRMTQNVTVALQKSYDTSGTP